MEKRKVYFAGSIRGGRDDAKVYSLLIDKLKEKFVVLTEHIGDVALGDFGEKSLTDQEIYQRDISWIDDCDFLFAEVSKTSLGVGYELGYAEAKGKKVYCVYDKNKVARLSAMLLGNENFECFEYNNLTELFDYFDKI